MNNPNDAQRPKGFYWVKFWKPDHEVMRWDGKHWHDTDGDEIVGTICGMQVDEKQIKREEKQ